MLDMGCITWSGQEDLAGMVMEMKVSDGASLPKLLGDDVGWVFG